jgi:prefoldin beta subunit
MSEEMEKKIEEMQMLEGQLHGFMAQKQGAQIELNEIENALGEMKGSDEVYKVVSGMMFKSTKDKLENELKEKMKVLEMKINSIEKQENILEKNSEELKKELNESMKAEADMKGKK